MRSSRSCGRPTGQPRCQVRPFIERQTLPGMRVMLAAAPSPWARGARGRLRRGSGPPSRTTLPGGTLSTRCTGLLPRSSHGCLAVRKRQRESSRGAIRVWARPRSSVVSTSTSRQRPLRLSSGRRVSVTGREAVPSSAVARTATSAQVSPMRRSTSSDAPATGSPASSARGTMTGASWPAYVGGALSVRPGGTSRDAGRSAGAAAAGSTPSASARRVQTTTRDFPRTTAPPCPLARRSRPTRHGGHSGRQGRSLNPSTAARSPETMMTSPGTTTVSGVA